MLDVSSCNALRAVLDRYDVGGRLRYVRDFIWRGGELELHANGDAGSVWYSLRAEWPAPVLERDDAPVPPGIVDWRRPVVEGRWVRGTSGYELRIGIDLCVPSAMYIRSQGYVAHVPFLNRPPEQVEHALSAELTAYVHGFLDRCQPVGQASGRDAERLAQRFNR